MNHDLAALERAPGRVVVHHVALDEMEMRVAFDVRELNRIAMQVVVNDNVVGLDEALHQMRADESGAAGDADALVREGHPRIFHPS